MQEYSMFWIVSLPGSNREFIVKVLHVIASMSAVRGGTTIAVANLSAALSRLGIHVDIATTDDDGPNQHIDVAHGTFIETPVARHVYFRRQTNFYSTSIPMRNWLARHIAAYDVVHVHGLFNFAALVGARAAHACDRPYVLTPHGTLDSWGLRHHKPILKRLSIALLESAVLRRAAAVHLTSDLERSETEKLRFLRNTTVIPLGMDISPFLLPPPLQRPKQFSSDLGVKPTILFLSRVDHKKGLDVLLDAFRLVLAAIPSAVLAIAGDGHPQLIRALQQQVERLEMADSVRWLGFVSGENKLWLLSNCSLFVLPSQSENFGLAVVEAMASGIPVIVSPGVALAQMVARHGAGEVCEALPSPLARTLVSWLQDPNRCKAAGTAGRDLVKSEMTLDTLGARMATLYERIIAGRADSA